MHFEPEGKYIDASERKIEVTTIVSIPKNDALDKINQITIDVYFFVELVVLHLVG